MTAALLGVLGYFGFGIICFLIPRARFLSALALVCGTISFAIWAPGFPRGHLGLGDWAIPWEGDALAAAFWGLSLFLHAVLLLEEVGKPRHFYALLTLLFGTVLSLVLSRDLFNLYVSLELTSLIAFLLVGLEGRAAQVWASLKYLILTSCGMILYLLGVGFIYARAGSLSLPALSAMPPDTAIRLGVGLILAGAAAKGGVFLYAQWLPTAHGYAPSSVSAVLSGLVVKMGIVAMARIAGAYGAGDVLVALGLITGFLGIYHAFWEKRIKVFLAYSTMSQLGYMLLGFGWGAWEGALAYAVAHGLFKPLLFLAAGRAEDEAGTHLIQGLAGKLMLSTRLGLGLGTVAIAGLPPLAGYAAKGLLFLNLPPWGKWALFALSVGTAASFSKLLPTIVRGRKGWKPTWGQFTLGLVVVGGGVALCIGKASLLAPSSLISGLGAIAAGYVVFHLLRKLPLRPPHWRLDESLLALFLAGCALLFWVLLH